MRAQIHAFGTSETGSRVRLELAAMRSIAAALEELPDDAARERALRWAVETFGLNVTDASTQTLWNSRPAPERPQITEATRPDPALTVDDLEALFEPPTPPERWGLQPRSSDAKTRHDVKRRGESAGDDRSVSSMIHSFVRDFQKLVDDWRG
jgi:hypothetical protein